MSGAWSISARAESGVFVDLAEQATGQEPRLHLENAAVADSVAEHGVCNELLHPTLVGEKQSPSRGRSHGHSRRVRLKILGTEPAAVDHADHDRVGHERSELLHQIEGEGRTPKAWLMIEAEERVEPDGRQGKRKVLGEQRVDEG